MDLLSREETLIFIRDLLGLPVRTVPCLSSPTMTASKKLTFLENLLRAYLDKEPFQSITLMSDEVKDRHRPSWNEIKSNIFLLRGGLCYWLNTFMYVLLDSLGCNVSMVHSTVTGLGHDNHVVVLIHDLTAPGDLHLVDVGIGYYFPRPIPLNFYDESPVYKDSFLVYKFKKESDTKICLLKAASEEKNSVKNVEELKGKHSMSAQEYFSTQEQHQSRKNLAQKIKRKTKFAASAMKDGINDNNIDAPILVQEYKWEVFFSFNPKETFKNLNEFYPCFDVYFSDVTKLPFHSTPRAMRWNGGRFEGIVNSELIEEKEEGQLTKTQIIKPKSNSDQIPTSDNVVKPFQSNTEVRGESNEKPPAVYTSRPIQEASNELLDKNTYQNSGTTSEDGHQELEPLLKAYKNHFPQFPTPMIEAALKYWQSQKSSFDPNSLSY